jgi:hypothetical protein
MSDFVSRFDVSAQCAVWLLDVDLISASTYKKTSLESLPIVQK